MTSTARALLTEVDQLDPGERQKQVVATARRLERTDPERLDALLGELAAGDAHARRVAVLAATCTQRTIHLETALSDPATSVARLALGAKCLPDEALEAVLDRGPLGMRTLAYRKIRRERRTALASRALPSVRTRWGDREAVRLLVSCDRETLEAALPELGEALGSWTLIVERFPDVAERYAVEALNGLSGFALEQQWGEIGRLVAALAHLEPVRTLDLAERFGNGRLPRPCLQHVGRLLAVDPARVAALLLAHSERAWDINAVTATHSCARRLRTLPDDVLGELIQRASSGMDTAVLRALPPSRREAVFERSWQGRDRANTVFSDHLLDLLPDGARIREARRILALPRTQTDPASVASLSAHFPVDEAVPVLEALLTSPQAEDRSVAYAQFVRNAERARDPAVLTALLERLKRVRNEQDPVRGTVLRMLAKVPVDRFESAAVEPLARLVDDALNARDSSSSTRNAIGELAVRLLWSLGADPDRRPIADWALRTVEALGAWDASAALPGGDLRQNLRCGQEHDLWGYLRGPVRAALDRGRPEPLFRFATLLGRRAWAMDEVQALLGGEAQSAPSDGAVETATSLWLRDPRKRVERAVALAVSDASLLTRHEVLGPLAAKRPSSLGRLLAGKRLKGRFDTRKAVHVPSIRADIVRRWAPHQQAAYRALLERGLRDARGGRHQVASYARALASVPGADLQDYAARTAGDDEIVSEAFLTGLGQTDDPALAIELLRPALATNSARVAVYAFSRCVRWLPPTELAVVADTLASKDKRVGIRKVSARLLGLHKPEGAVEALITAASDPELHRDVRIAVLHSLRAFPDVPAVWDTWRRAAVDSDEHVARSLTQLAPAALPRSHRAQYARLIGSIAEHHDAVTARSALERLGAWCRWQPDIATVLGDHAVQLDRLTTWRSAVATVARPEIWTVAPGLPATVARQLLEQAPNDPTDDPTVDQPSMVRLKELVHAMLWQGQPARLEPASTMALIQVLEVDDATRRWAAELLLTLTTAGSDAEVLLHRAADLLAGRGNLQTILDHRDRLPGHWDGPEATELVRGLAGRGDLAGGLIAAKIIRSAGYRGGWTDQRRNQVEALRLHPAADVRDEARDIELV